MKLIRHTAFAVILTLASTVVMAQEPSSTKNWLFTQTASGFSFNGQTLTLPYEREIFAFTDRPNREHRYLNAHEFQSLWETGDNNFTQDPPNAVLTWVSDGEIMEAELVLAAVEVISLGRALQYTLGGSQTAGIPAQAEHASLFIDGSMATYTRNYIRASENQ